MQEYEFSERIMGSDASVSIIAADGATAGKTATRLFQIAKDAESKYSRFQSTSELSELNRSMHKIVSDDFMQTFMLARKLYHKTNGVFNPLVDISRFGYNEDIEKVKGAERPATNVGDVYNTDLDAVIVDTNSGTITLQEGQQLDFGGFLKGHIAERMCAAAYGHSGVIVNLGGDIFTRGYDENAEPFTFVVDNPITQDEEIEFVATNVGIATSGSYNRYWKLQQKAFHHILDRSGHANPTTDIVSATVIARTGAEAEAFATTALSLGSSAAIAFLTNKKCQFYLIRHDGSICGSGTRSITQRAATTSI